MLSYVHMSHLCRLRLETRIAVACLFRDFCGLQTADCRTSQLMGGAAAVKGRSVSRLYLLTHLIDLTDYPLACQPTENALKMLIRRH